MRSVAGRGIAWGISLSSPRVFRYEIGQLLKLTGNGVDDRLRGRSERGTWKPAFVASEVERGFQPGDAMRRPDRPGNREQLPLQQHRFVQTPRCHEFAQGPSLRPKKGRRYHAKT